MPPTVQEVPEGTVTTPRGFLAGATYAGIKTYSQDKLDLGLLFSESPAVAAGVFTTNRIKSPSVVLTQEHLRKGRARAILATSGIANTCVGEQGVKDAQECVALAEQRLGVEAGEVLFCSTGIIGMELPMALIRASVDKIQIDPQGGHLLARAILTTDSRPKEVAFSFQEGDRTITVGGIAKGSGMINPNMATLLAFLSTDAPVELSFLQASLKETVDATLNMTTIDGDASTNDSVILLANGAAGGAPLAEGTPGAEAFQQALAGVCQHLAREIARDGEGATKLMVVTVEGARTLEEARRGAKAIATSSLVKSAVHGNDPNWGRIVARLGASGIEVEESRIALYINDVCIMEEGRPIPYFKDAVIVSMSGPEVSLRVGLNLGDARATAWGCDLSEEYVTFNAAYTT